MSAWADGAPASSSGLPSAVKSYPPSSPYDARNPSYPSPGTTPPPRRVSGVAGDGLKRSRVMEGLRGRSTRVSVAAKYTTYFAAILAGSGLTEWLTDGVRYASGGGRFMFSAITLITATGAVSTFFYVNMRAELVEKVRHYVFAITLAPGVLTAAALGAVQNWQYANEGSLGVTLQMALPAVFLATVALPAIIFVKEMLGIRTLHRSRLDDQEAVQLWTRQDGLQR